MCAPASLMYNLHTHVCMNTCTQPMYMYVRLLSPMETVVLWRCQTAPGAPGTQEGQACPHPIAPVST